MDKVKSFLMRFVSFEKLIGGLLIRILYYIGLVGIAFAFLGFVFSSLQMMSWSFFQGFGMLLFSPILAGIMVLAWRFLCELYIVLFRMSEQLNEIKIALGGTATPASTTMEDTSGM